MLKKDTQPKYTDQVEYYIDHLKKQNRAKKSRFSILGLHHKNLDDSIRKPISKLPKNSRVLDAGCGLSAWTTEALRAKYKISGVDGEPDAIEACQKLYTGQDYKIGNLYDLKEYGKNTYDAVVMREVIEHFITPEKAVKEMYRILKPGGIFILTTPNYDSLLLYIIENTYNRFFGGSCKPYRDDVHPSKFKPRTLRKLLENHSFKILNLYTIDYGISTVCVAQK